ncbi:CD44 antigen isoform X4 [Eumetopias jubatus]|uniref:CD44 antigen isoform X4 n=1 Tax=Eumetopias jubatus TaxID=34886 RepID=UPI00101602FA|nr:CD44 antigen isoform X4 [Eumetopias jubatus]
MDKFWGRLAWGLCLLQLSLAQIDLNITCRYAGVFHVEKNGRYSISRTEAADLCKAFNSTLPTMAQMEKALSMGFETCRYGFIEGHVVIPRIHPNSICAANNTGVYILTSNTSQYDTYCFNASAPPKEDCTSVTHLPNAFEGPITITIVNRDGTRYSQTGEYRTNPEDINPSSPTDDDVSSGSSSERSTSGGYNIFHTHLPTVYPTPDQDSTAVSDNPEHTPITSTDSNIISAGWEPTEENEDERDKHPSYSGSGIDDDEDFISSTIPTTPRLFNHPKQNQDWTSRSPGESNPGILLQTTTRMTDVDQSGTSTKGEAWPREPHSPLIHHEHHDEEEAQHPASTTPAQEGHPDQRMTTQSQEDSSWTYFFDPISHPMGRDHQTERWMEDQDSSVHPSGTSHTTHGSESAGHSSGSQEGGANTTSEFPMRKPQIPEWLIILASLLALALILAVCIAVNSRRRCGQKKKLVINNGNGAVGDRKPSGINGEASKSQEMVHLVNKEPSETPDQYMTADETRNLQNVDMKIGV